MPRAGDTVAAPRPRDRAATEARILAAVGEMLARDGFGAVAVNLRCHEELRPSPEQIHAA